MNNYINFEQFEIALKDFLTMDTCRFHKVVQLLVFKLAMQDTLKRMLNIR